MVPEPSSHVHDDPIPVHSHLTTVADRQPIPMSIRDPAKHQRQTRPGRLRNVLHAVHDEGQCPLIAVVGLTHDAIGRLRSDRPYGERILRRWRRRSGRAGSGLRSRLLRIAKGIVIYEYPRAVNVADVQIVVVVKYHRVRHGTEVVQVRGWKLIRPDWVVIHPNKPRTCISVVPYRHSIGAVERRFPCGRIQVGRPESSRMPTKDSATLPRIRP